MSELMPAAQVSAARMCSSCPKMCRSACATQRVTRNERHQPWGHARQVVAALGDGGGFADSDLVDGVYTCATCAACTVPCHVDGVETPELIWAARAAIHRAGATPEVGREAVAAARAGRVPAPAAEVTTSVDPAPVLSDLRSLSTPGAALLYLPGCSTLGLRPQSALAAARTLRALDIPFDIPATHQCCGMPALTFGDSQALTAMQAALQSTIEAHPATTITVQSPSCSWLLGTREPVAGRTVEPLAVTLARALAARTPKPEQTVIAYHDPCYLSRHQRIREQPRDALRAAGYSITELPHRGDTTQCSGQGGGLALTHPDIAAGYLTLLSADIEEAGAHTTVTACPSCAAALESRGLPTLDLAEAIANAL